MYRALFFGMIENFCVKRKIENSIQVKICIPTLCMGMYTYKNKTATSIQVRKLFKGGN